MTTPLPRRRTRGLSMHTRNTTTNNTSSSSSPPIKIDPKSTHTSDPFLQDFLDPTFDAATYLNATLPRATTSSTADLSTSAQALTARLAAHSTRLTDALGRLTDDVLRSGGRLAYEVELLRGETHGLAEALAAAAAATTITTDDDDKDKDDQEPACVAQLRTLTLVRARLDAVIKTFGDAMEFAFPPSEVSVSSGFLSVSAPDSHQRQGHMSTEEKGQRTLKKLRDEVAGLMDGAENGDRIKGVEDATRRVEEIKELCVVWRGTAEEKGRQRFVESLARMVEDRHRELVREVEAQRERELQLQQQQQQQQQQQAARNKQDESGARREQGGSSDAAAAESRGPLGGYGFMNQWQKIRGGL